MGPPTLKYYTSHKDFNKQNWQDWNEPYTLSPIEVKDNWWVAAIAFPVDAFPGYTYRWRFYAWSKYEGGRQRINEDSESFWSYTMGTSTQVYGYWSASQTFSPGSAIYIAGYANELWQWWFDMVEINPILYTLTVVNNNGQNNDTYTKYYNDTNVIVYAGTRQGHTFAYFTSNFGIIYSGVPFTWNRASNEILTSVWTIISYTVTFNNNGKGTSSSSVTVTYGSPVTFPTVKAVGYTFLRWVNSSNTTYASISSLSGDITLYAVWEQKGTINFSELERVYNGTRGIDPLPGVKSISIGKFRAESGQIGTNQIKLITHFQGKG